MASVTRRMRVNRLFLCLPITFSDEVSHTCVKIVIGNCKLRNACDRISPWNGLDMANMRPVATTNDSRAPILECKSLIWNGSENAPANIEAPAMDDVMVEHIPASNKATANITPALDPTSGSSISFACSRAVTGVPLAKNSDAARIIMAEFMAHPMIMENMVSRYS